MSRRRPADRRRRPARSGPHPSATDTSWPEPVPSRGHRRWHVLRAVLIGYVVLSVAGAVTGLLAASPAATFRSDDSALDESNPHSVLHDPADSWSAFNEGSAAQAPVWGADEFLAAVADVPAGGITRMPGAQTRLDDAAVTAAVGGTDLVVVVTPPTPLGAVETTRVRDNTVQKAWADDHGRQLIMVHGQDVYLPYGKALGEIIGATPGSGVALREGLRTGDATGAVVRVAQEARAQQRGERDAAPPVAGDAAWTAADLALTGTRPPTAAELAPVQAALDGGDLYVDPAVTPAPTYRSNWAAAGQGRPVKVVVLPYADARAAPVDWTGALARRYPQAVVLVLIGKWIESAGTDRQVMVDAIVHTADLGGYALAAAAPAVSASAILDWVTGVDAAAVRSHAFARPLPVLASSSFPRWLDFLLLATAVIIAAGVGAGQLVELRRSRSRGSSRETWRSAVFSGLTDCYVQLAGAPYLGPGGPDLPAAAQHRLDAGYAGLLQLHGADLATDDDAGPVAAAAWDELDAAAAVIGQSRLGPSSTLPAALRHEPPAPAGGDGRRPLVRRILARVPRRWKIRVAVAAGCVVAGVVTAVVLQAVVSRPPAGADLAGLRTSNVVELHSPGHPDADTLRAVIGDRAMIVVQVGEQDDFADIDLADQAVRAYPDSVAFVLQDGDIKGAAVGADAGTSGYDDDAFIDDYDDMQNQAGGDVPTTRQLALLYDRIAADGHIHPAVRSTYDGPRIPWVVVAVGLVLAMIAAAFAVRLAARRAVAAADAGADDRAERDALRIRVAASARDELRAPERVDPAAVARAQDLLARIGTAPASGLDGLGREVDALSGAGR